MSSGYTVRLVRSGTGRASKTVAHARSMARGGVPPPATGDRSGWRSRATVSDFSAVPKRGRPSDGSVILMGAWAAWLWGCLLIVLFLLTAGDLLAQLLV